MDREVKIICNFKVVKKASKNLKVIKLGFLQVFFNTPKSFKLTYLQKCTH